MNYIPGGIVRGQRLLRKVWLPESLCSGADKIHIRYFCSSGSFSLELAHIERIIKTLVSHQLVMGCILYDLTAIEHHDLGRVANGCQAVSDGEAGLVAHQLAQAIPDYFLKPPIINPQTLHDFGWISQYSIRL